MTLRISHFRIKKPDNLLFISNPALVPHNSERVRNQNNKHNTFGSCKIWDHLSVQPKNIYKIISFSKEWLLELHHMQVQQNPKMKKVSTIGDNHLKLINKEAI